MPEKRLIVIFDVPEFERKKRDWLRIELRSEGFIILQKSAWFGPPIPYEFANRLRDLGILPYMKFFEAKEADILGVGIGMA